MNKSTIEVSLEHLIPKHKKIKLPESITRRKVALITGITGQDGLYMAAHLLHK